MGEQVADGSFEADHVTEGRSVRERELQWGGGVIKALDDKVAVDVSQGTQDGQDVGGSAEADVPDDEWAARLGEPGGDVHLAHVERLRLGLGSNDRMEGFALDACADGPGAAGHLHEFIIGFCHVGWRVSGWVACGDTQSRGAEP